MPRVKGSRFNHDTGKFEKPVEGGAIGGGQADPIREPVKTVLRASGTEQEFRDSLSDGTEPQDEKPKRKYTKKPAEASPDPNMSDPRYVKAVGKMVGMGGATVVETAFKAAKSPLTPDEREDVEDYFYVVGKKGNLDPTQSWFLMLAFFVVMILRLIAARTEIGKMFDEFFSDKKEEKDREDLKKSAERASLGEDAIAI